MINSCKDSHYEEHFGVIAVEVACRQWFEVRIDKTAIEADKVQFRFELSEGSSVVQTLPGFGELEIDLRTDYSENWFA